MGVQMLRMNTFRKTVGAVICSCLLFSAVAQSDDDWLFTSSDDDLFTSSSDDWLFGGTSDDDLFFSGSDDDLFGGDDMFGEEITVENSSSSPLSIFSGLDLINTEKVRFGGSASFSLNSAISLTNVFSSNAQKWQYWKEALYNTSLSPSIGAELYFDAHPDEILRLYGKVGVSYPFAGQPQILEKNDFGVWNPSNSIGISGLPSNGVPNFYVKELFTDFSLGDNVYFRFGKHTVKWGVGYFFSPADVINLGAIDPENPTADREGPVSLRTQITIPGTQNCIYIYGVLGDKNVVRDAALAAKYEFLVGNYEIGIGAWCKWRRAPRLIATATGSIKDISLFAEGVFAWGLEEEWVEDRSLSGKKPFFQATLGGSYTWNEPKISLSMQYFFNGFGVPDIKESTLQELLTKQLNYSYCGQHYVAMSLSKSSLFDNNDMSLSLFGLMSLTDLSGMASLSYSAKLFRNCSLSLGPSFTFGPEKSEYIYLSSMGDQQTLLALMMSNGEKWRANMGFSVSFRLGGGKF